eukprot:gnl/MRDRNA2_/MRDRNA2_184589_c0_seq1.p1 gnl/MRDRNA2_/MRDRNA2_184589_c0~~gnl/MRDRNA2_/MRDRNA2_184589_c0_seq1.p1  ORF type:complete len:271 (-),score=46.15 gnl/MRDRNA2_/MRDRNA2_184589_c0_seq1:100-912(-)
MGAYLATDELSSDKNGQQWCESAYHCKQAVDTSWFCASSSVCKFEGSQEEREIQTFDAKTDDEIPMQDFKSEFLDFTSTGDETAQPLHWSVRQDCRGDSTFEMVFEDVSWERMGDEGSFCDAEDTSLPTYVDDEGSDFLHSHASIVQVDNENTGSLDVNDHQRLNYSMFPDVPLPNAKSRPSHQKEVSSSVEPSMEPFCYTSSNPGCNVRAISSSMNNFCFVPSIPGCDTSRLEYSCLNRLENHCLGPRGGREMNRNERGLCLIHVADNS